MGWDIDRFLDKDNIVKDIICTICTEVVSDAKQTPCDHMFCKECISEWLKSGKQTCPIDREKLSLNDLKAPSRMTRQLIDSLIVKCKYFSEGCKLMAKYEDLQQLIKHETEGCHVILNASTSKIENELQKKLEFEVNKKTNESQKKIDAQDTKIVELNRTITEMDKKILEQEKIFVETQLKNKKAWQTIQKQGKDLIKVMDQYLANENISSQQIGAYKLSTLAKACENIRLDSAHIGTNFQSWQIEYSTT